MSTRTHIPTAADLRVREPNQTLAQHCDAIRDARDQHFARAEELRQRSIAGGRDLTADERRTVEKHIEETGKLSNLLESLANSPEGRQINRDQIIVTGGDGGHVRVTRNEGTYRPDEVRTSWVRDLVSAGLHGDRDAAERLHRNNAEVAEEHRAVDTGAASGFVPPAWLVADYVRLARAGRVVANRVTNRELPPGTMSIELPRMATGTATAEQANENTAVQNTNATFDHVTADVATIAGQQVLSRQLVEQSAINIDREVLGDLLADLAVKVDRFVISNNAANKRGLLNVSGVNAITYTDTTPTVGELYPKQADAIQQIHTNRFMAADHIFMHPRRWGWIMAAVDGQSRPLAVPAANAPQNVIAAVGSVTAEGFVGSMHGLPVFVDPNIPTNLGSGTNEDRIIVARASDVILYESLPRAEVLRERYADQLSVGLLVFEFLALHSERYPKSLSVISGSGLAAPTF